MAGCGGRGCGFVSRSFLGIGGLIVSRGLGSCSDVPIVFEEPPLTGLQEGTGRRTRVAATTVDAPKAAIRFTGKAGKKKC